MDAPSSFNQQETYNLDIFYQLSLQRIENTCICASDREGKITKERITSLFWPEPHGIPQEQLENIFADSEVWNTLFSRHMT